MEIGFIKIHRKILNWEWYSDPNTCRVFFHLLLTANFENKKWRGIEIKRGQLLFGRAKLAKSVTLSQQQTRTALDKLKSTNEITIKTTNKFSILTLTNYDLYQSRDEKDNQQNNQQLNKRVTNNQPTNNQQVTTTKEGKEVKEVKEGKEDLSEFLKFWDLYDYKKSKPEALKSFQKSLKNDSFENIMIGVQAYVKWRGADKQYWKYPATWLNKESWKDEYLTTKATSDASKFAGYAHLRGQNGK